MSTGSTLAALELLAALLDHAARLSLILREAQAEGRDLSEAEWTGILTENAEAMARLEAEIARARSEGR